VPPRRLAAFAGLAQSSYLAVPLGRFMLRALHDDLATRRGWRSRDGVRLGRQSLADLGWWAELRGSKHVGRAIWRPAETRLLHTDASDLGWGAAVDLAQRHAPAHGFWSPDELPFHITWKELVAVRKGVEFFLPQLWPGAVCCLLAGVARRAGVGAYELLGWLLDGSYQALPPSWERRRGAADTAEPTS